MRVAIMYTGSLRTIKKAMQFFKKNVLLHADVHVFACVQNDTTLSESEHESWLYSELGDHLKSVEWFNLAKHPDLVARRDDLLSTMNINEHTSNYLKNSGSMIEYYQMQLAYIKMVHFERRNTKYDYIIRVRTDTIYAKPIDFHWLHWTDSEVDLRVEQIKQELVKYNIELSDYNIVHYFMTTIISDTLIPNMSNITSKTTSVNSINYTNGKNLNDYIKNGSYILTLRKNLLYIVKRDLFYTIPSLGSMYGLMYGPEPDGYWWNSESQFEALCYRSNITIHDYSTVFDENSLYNYEEKIYFDLDYNIVNHYMLYCIIRN